MKQAIAGLVLVAAFASVHAEETKSSPEPAVKHLRWWVLPAKGAAFPMPGRSSPEVLRSADEASDALTSQPPTMDGGPRRPPVVALPTGIDWDGYMVVVFAAEGRDGAARDVVSVSSDGKEILVRAMKEEGADNGSQHGEAMAVIVTRSDLPVRVGWSDGKLAAMRKERDCSRDEATHKDLRTPGGLCPRCGNAKTVTQNGRLCGACAADLEECPICGKRVAGPTPLKK